MECLSYEKDISVKVQVPRDQETWRPVCRYTYVMTNYIDIYGGNCENGLLVALEETVQALPLKNWGKSCSGQTVPAATWFSLGMTPEAGSPPPAVFSLSLYHRVQTGSGAHPASYPMVIRRGVKLTTHLHLVPRLRIRGTIPPFPIRLHGVVLSYVQDTSSWPGILISTGTTLTWRDCYAFFAQRSCKSARVVHWTLH
jgi:hypothetical protein